MEQNPIIGYQQQMPSRGRAASSGHGPVFPIFEEGMLNNLRDHLSIIFKHKYKIGAIFIVALILAPLAYFLAARFLTPLYEAKSVVLVKSGREYSDPELGTNKTPISFGRGEIFSTERMILRNRDLKERIISTVGLAKIFPDIAAHPPSNMPALEAAIISFDKKLTINDVRNSNFIEVSFFNEDRDIAAQVVNLLVSYYVEKRREVLSDPKSMFFLEKKLAEYRQKLRESEESLETFRRTFGFYSFDKQMDFLLQRRAQVADALSAAQDESKALKESFAALKNLKLTPEVNYASTIDEGALAVTDSDELKQLKAALVPLLQKEQELLGKYTEHSQFVINVRNEIQSIRDRMKKEEARLRSPKRGPVETPNLALQDLEQEKNMAATSLSAAEEKIAGLKEELTNCQKQINELGSQEKRLNELNREREHNEQYYKIYFGKVEESRISEDIGRQDLPSVTVVQPATPPAEPVKKNFGLLQYFAFAGILGLVAGVALAYLLEFISQGIRNAEDVWAHLGVPLLVAVPYKSR